MADDKPIIVIKKKGGHGGHHGGAWKVAFADFMTAMMAFFMVMWLLNSAEAPTRQAIASYFRKPGLFQQGSGTPLEIGGSGILEDSYAPPKPDDAARDQKWELRKRLPTLEEELEREAKLAKRLKGMTKEKPEVESDPDGILVDADPAKHGKSTELSSAVPEPKRKDLSDKTPYMRKVTREELADQRQRERESAAQEEGEGSDPSSEPTKEEALERLKEAIETQIAASPELQKLLGAVDIKVDADGLNIEIMDTEKSSMFASGSAKVLPSARSAFSKLAGIINKLPNTVEIVGHTDAKPFSLIQGGYGNWELSTSRANEARKILVEEGYGHSRITGVTGKADTELKNRADPFAASNRRITLKMKFDLSKTIDLAKNPAALDEAAKEALAPRPTTPPVEATKGPTLEEILSEKSSAPPPPGAAQGAKPVALPPRKPTAEPVHELTPAEILKGIKSKKTEKAPELDPDPESTSGGNEPKQAPFGESPVMKPRDLFSDLF